MFVSNISPTLPVTLTVHDAAGVPMDVFIQPRANRVRLAPGITVPQYERERTKQWLVFADEAPTKEAA